MKKGPLLICTALFFFIISSYLFIPAKISFSKNVLVMAAKPGVVRILFDQRTWPGWWPGTMDSSAGTFSYKQFTYKLQDKKIQSLIISANNNTAKAITSLEILPAQRDSLEFLWTGELISSYNPIKRIKGYYKFIALQEDIDSILVKIKTFFSSTKNIYGYNIRRETVKDSLLVSTFGTSKAYPTIEFIYSMIDDLKKYIKTQAAQETGFPMLNVNAVDSNNTYVTKVAIPVNKKLQSSGKIEYKWMLGRGNILVTEVKGGNGAIEKAFRQVENYMSDRQYVAPAIPFLSLVTDRSKEPDSSKWVTKIYYPVMYY
jgi:hypothetical protein